MGILRDRRAVLAADDACRIVNELPSRRDQRHRAHGLLEIVDRAEHLEVQLRNAVAEAREGHPLEHNVGRAAIGRRPRLALFRLDQTVQRLRLAASMHADLIVGLLQFLSVGPDAPNAGDLALAERKRQICVVAVLDGRHRRALRTASGCHPRCAPLAAFLLGRRVATCGLGRRHLLFFEMRGPDQLARHAHASVDARDRRPLARA